MKKAFVTQSQQPSSFEAKLGPEVAKSTELRSERGNPGRHTLGYLSSRSVTNEQTKDDVDAESRERERELESQEDGEGAGGT